MAKLENIQPRLKPGRLDIKEDQAFFTARDEAVYAVDPLALEFLRLCNGSYSIKEIIILLHQKALPFSFAAVHKCLTDFSKKDLFQNSEMFFNIKDKQTKREITEIQPNQIPLYLRKISLFSGLAQDAINHVADLCKIETFEAGQTIIKRGSQGADAYALLNGEVAVYSHFHTIHDSQPIATLPPMTVFGESAAIMEKTRTADVVATTKCTVLKFNVKKIVEPVGSKYAAKNLKIRLVLSQILKTHPFFRDLPGELANLFMNCCRIERFKKESVVVQQGDQGEDFYFIVAGSAVVLKDRAPEAKLAAGNYFGEVAALNRTERNATVMTDSDSLLLKMDGKNFITVLASNLDMALKIEEVAKERSENPEEVTVEVPFVEATLTKEFQEETLSLVEDWDLGAMGHDDTV